MRALVAGLVLIMVSGTVLLWQRCRDPQAGDTRAAVPARGLIFRAERDGQTFWLCGSIHLLRAQDYPLPAAYRDAFARAKTIVMELPPGSAHDPQTQDLLTRAGTLPPGESLEKSLTAPAWRAVSDWAQRAGHSVEALQRMKPWFAAVTISLTTSQRLGYHASRGIESWFAANLGGRRGEGLETPAEQIAMFDRIDPATQEAMLLQAIDEEASAASRLQSTLAAWRTGDTEVLGALIAESMRKFPGVQKLLVDDRNAAWVTKMESYLAGAVPRPILVVTGSAHLVGPGSVIERLRENGFAVTQIR